MKINESQHLCGYIIRSKYMCRKGVSRGEWVIWKGLGYGLRNWGMGARLEEAQLVEGLHVELEVLLRRQQAGAQLAQHSGREPQRLPQIIIVLQHSRISGF